MYDRVKKLRKALNLTQQEMADKLGISRNSLASYETGKSNMGSAVVSLICKEFHVNEKWLRTGAGRMFNKVTRDEQIAEFIGDTLSSVNDSFRRRFIAMLARLNEDEWAVLERMALDLAAQHIDAKAQEQPSGDNKKEDQANSSALAEERPQEVVDDPQSPLI